MDNTEVKPTIDSRGRFFHYQNTYPYSTYLVLDVKDQGNSLPVNLAIIQTDPEQSADVEMTVGDARLLLHALTKAISTAERAGLG